MPTAYTSRVLYHLVGSKNPDNDSQNLETLRAILKSMELRQHGRGPVWRRHAADRPGQGMR